MPLLVSLRSTDGAYMCAEDGGGREVVVNRRKIGHWEKFWLYLEDPIHDVVYLKTIDRRYFLTADLMRQDTLVADREKLGPWELFRLEELGAGCIALKACNDKYLRINGSGVAADDKGRGSDFLLIVHDE